MDVETTEAIERLSGRIELLESSLRTEVHHRLAEMRRHAVMLNETLREDIRFVAEAVAAIAVKIDSFQR